MMGGRRTLKKSSGENALCKTSLWPQKHFYFIKFHHLCFTWVFQINSLISLHTFCSIFLSLCFVLSPSAKNPSINSYVNVTVFPVSPFTPNLRSIDYYRIPYPTTLSHYFVEPKTSQQSSKQHRTPQFPSLTSDNQGVHSPSYHSSSRHRKSAIQAIQCWSIEGRYRWTDLAISHSNIFRFRLWQIFSLLKTAVKFRWILQKFLHTQNNIFIRVCAWHVPIFWFIYSLPLFSLHIPFPKQIKRITSILLSSMDDHRV